MCLCLVLGTCKPRPSVRYLSQHWPEIGLLLPLASAGTGPALTNPWCSETDRTPARRERRTKEKGTEEREKNSTPWACPICGPVWRALIMHGHMRDSAMQCGADATLQQAGGHLATLQRCLVACPVGSTAHGGHCSEHDRPSSAVPRHAAWMGPAQAVQPRENRTIALLDGFQQTRRSVSQAVAACGQWPIGQVRALLPARSRRTEVQSTRPCYWRHYPTLI